MKWIDFFIDPLFRAPVLGSMCICFSSALLGTFLTIRKRALVAESLSHASYPGITLAVAFCSAFATENQLSFFLIFGAFLSALFGFILFDFLQKKTKLSSDSSLTLILAAFFGLGTLIASHVQFTEPRTYRLINGYLYGQVATLTDAHLFYYLLFSLGLTGFIVFFYKELKTICFDWRYAKSIGLPVVFLEIALLILTVLIVVLGIRSVGVVLMAAMLAAPAISAKQFSNKLSSILIYAGIIGALCGFFGNYLAVKLEPVISTWLKLKDISLPTGPIIVLVASSIACISLLFAPRTGVFSRYLRIAQFRWKRREENFLKLLWKEPQEEIFLPKIQEKLSFSSFVFIVMTFRFRWKKWIILTDKLHCCLTGKGKNQGAQIVRLHRLWELYLVSLGEEVEKVHQSAEEMEHILNPAFEKELTAFLSNPSTDPHSQPIPSLEEKEAT